MKGKLGRAIAALAAGALLAVTASGVAAAGTSGGGKGTSSTQAAADQVLQLRDDLTRAAYAGDVGRTQDTLAKLDPVLADLAAGQQYSIQADAQQRADTAHRYSTETSRVLADPNAEVVQVPDVPLPEIPDLPPPLTAVSDLLKAVLGAVTGLLSSLLGGGVPALPVPETPELPAP
ncbi:hypothetical protein [Prauserella muralis]|uniref:Uncharacterized protein n=1 Tax=Prauserella muralis TaxID=588067 RepID=A0A2V4B7K4_9PSEU|nr:hypothetical protein [Prauserella muralis]PXY31238.1 hypothetical protein BAY60_02190 [Prauserella muralis]TWE14457.1 hypothetical protein FHX69_6605 [Prauserella muralis]